MWSVSRHLAALAIAGAVALTVFVTFAWFNLGFVPLAALALVAFWGTALPLLAMASRRRHGHHDPGTEWKVRWWLLGGTLAYVLIAQFLVGNRPERVVAVPEPAPGTRYWSLPNGTRIAYVRSEGRVPRREQPVIVLHDGPGVPALPRMQQLGVRPFDFLSAEGFDVYYYDQLGAGLSSRIDLGKDPPYTMRRHVQDLEEIRGMLGTRQMILIGEGWGSTLATQYLLRHAEHVSQVILESPAPVWAPAWPAYIEPAARARMTDVQASALAALERPPVRLVVGRMVSDFNARVAHSMVPDWEADQWWTASMEQAVRLGQPRLSCASEVPAGLVPMHGLGFFAHSYTLRDASLLPDPRPAFGAMTTPALVVRGSCDYIDWRVSYEYLNALPGARYVAIPAAGHLIWLDQPGLHADVIRAFLRNEPLPLEFYNPGRVPKTN
jgi:proline iminopeptidase